ncbi:phytoene desaturase family protein [Streptomyces sp. NPDC059828]|uniref:phytoene desaturase family protein n=1 Tax=Streptomyces sp. NPDC059828 TaxID=3346965 RepID=UPI003648412B
MARIAVIGAGMGAMAAAARLAVAGHRVTVHERSGTFGGAVGGFERDGFAFDTGPGLLHLPAVYRDLFLKTGKQPLESLVEMAQVEPASRHLFADGTDVSLPNASHGGAVAALDSSLGSGTGERWGDFLKRARECWDRSRRPLLEEPLWPNWQVLGREPYPALRQRRMLRIRQAATLAQVGAWELGDPRLATLLDACALSYGLDPRRVPASAALLPYMEQAFGAWYVRGGMRSLARAVYERCLERGVEFVFSSEVTGVLERDGRAAGLELADGSTVEADQVVAAAGRGGLGERKLWRDGAVRPATADTDPGRFTVLLALRGARPAGAAHRTVVHSPDTAAEATAVFGDGLAKHPTVTVLRPDDPANRPDDAHEAVTLTATVSGDPVRWADEAVRERYADTLITAVGRVVPDARERLLWREVLTPAETGRVRPPALAGEGGAYLRPSNSTALPGLHLAGGWSHPGGGLAHAGMSGALVAGLIVEGEDFRGSQ